MYNRLTILYKFQLIDDQLDELEELRGDLPSAVRELEDQINRSKEDISSKEKEQKDSLKKREENEGEVEKQLENQKKFKAQLYQVRNNKEYDALTKEIDHTDDVVSKLEAENDGLADLSKSLTQQIEEFKPKLFELNDELKTNVQTVLEKLTGKKVELTTSVDSSILGGILAKVGDLVLDD